MEINKLNFGQFKSDRIVNPFEDLDVNSDGKINSEDKDATTDINILGQISILLTGSKDEDEDLELVDDIDKILSQKAGSTDCSDGSCEITAPTSTNDCPNGDCSVSAPSTTPARVNNPDGTYTETTTNASGQKIEKTFDASGKRISQKTTNKDGSVVNFTFKYNNDGSYTQTAVYSDKTRVTKFNSAGKRISYTEKYKDGTTKTATFKYNSNGSYSVIIKNKKTGSVTKKKYNAAGKITYSENKSKKTFIGGQTTKKERYTYNEDGSYKVVKSKNNAYGFSKVSVTNYDANGKKIKAGTSTNTMVSADSSNYKDKLNPNGVSFVVFSSPNCGHCLLLKARLKSVLPAVDGKANFAEINIRDAAGNDIQNNCDLLWSFAKKFNGNNINTIGLPMVVKFVNGKPEKIVQLNETNSAKTLDQILNECKSAAAKNTNGTSASSSATNTNTNTTTTQKKATSPTYVTGKNCKSKIAQKGVTYLIMGNSKGCGKCISLDKQIKKLMKNGKLQSPTILSMNIKDSDGSGKILDNYLTQFNMWQTRKDGSKYADYPLILKFVDGKPVGFVSNIAGVSDADLIKNLS